MSRHVKELFLRWSEQTLSTGERQKIEEHLKDCEDCRTYFKRLGELMDAKAHPAPRLSADPFLPQRIRALAEAEERAPQRAWRPSLAAFSLGTIALTAAVLIGAMIGSNASAQFSSSETTISYLSENGHGSVSSFAEGWDGLIPVENEEQQ